MLAKRFAFLFFKCISCKWNCIINVTLNLIVFIFIGYAYTYHKQLVHIEQTCRKRIEKMAKKLFRRQENRQRIHDSRHWCQWQFSHYGNFIHQTTNVSITFALDWFICGYFNFIRSSLKRAYRKSLTFVQTTQKHCTALKLVVPMVKAWTFPNHLQINSKFFVCNWCIWCFSKSIFSPP